MADDKATPPEDAGSVETAEAALDRLAARLRPPSISAQIRRLLPKIEAAIEAGATHEQIVETLRKSGIDISLNTFRSTLYRARKKVSKASRTKNPESGKRHQESASNTAEPAPGERDPLALPEKPKAFDWDPTERPKITFINKDDDESTS